MNDQSSSFDAMGLPDLLRRNVAAAGYVTPSPIQTRAIPPGLSGRDVIGVAQTGTGKTAAFALPMLVRLAGGRGTRGLILAPTRELALQIAEVFATLGKGAAVSVATVIGGANMNAQIKALRQQPAIVIATPGRLIDHLQQKTVDLRGIRVLVLDEADRMLDMGFLPQIRRILDVLPKERQTMLFSATMPPEIARLVEREQKDPVRIEIAVSGTTAERVRQLAYFVDEGRKPNLLLWLLDQEQGTVLVFTRTKHRADKVARILQRAGHSVERIHANRSLNQRLKALEGFKTGKHRVLVATDIAARGIDVANIAHVVNYDLPHVAEDYVHRIGRTARAAASGNAVSFVNADDRKLLKAIERLTRRQVPMGMLPTALPQAPGPVAPAARRGGERRESQRGGRGMTPQRGGRSAAPRREPFNPHEHERRWHQAAPASPTPQPIVRWGEAYVPPGGRTVYDSSKDERRTEVTSFLPGEGVFWEQKRRFGGKGGRGGRGGGQGRGGGGGRRFGGKGGRGRR